MTHHLHTRALGAIALTTALTFSVAACGTDDSSTTSSGSAASSSTESPTSTGSSGSSSYTGSSIKHNDADVKFATEMLPHHAQALTMVEMTKNRPLDPEVQQLADEIQAAQAPEITTMTGWLTQWGQPVPDTASSSGMGGMSGMDSSMPGMMSSEDMTSLQNSSDADFQTTWLTMMISHHEGAVEMAKTEISDGQHQPAVDLARSIVDSQSKEIATMKAILD